MGRRRISRRQARDDRGNRRAPLSQLQRRLIRERFEQCRRVGEVHQNFRQEKKKDYTKKLLAIFFLVMYAISAPNYSLSNLGSDVSTIAGIVSGIGVSQEIRDGNLAKDRVVGEMILGAGRSMNSLLDVGTPKLLADLEEIGQVLTKECGSGSGCGDVGAIENGITIFTTFDKTLTEDQRSILKDTDAFKDLTTLLKQFRKITGNSHVTSVIESLESLDLSDEDSVIEALSAINVFTKEIFKLKSSFDFIEQHITGVLDQTGQDALTKKIDNLLSLESIKKSAAAQEEVLKKMKNQLTDFSKKADSLMSVLTVATVDRIEETLDRVLPIVGSSKRLSKHPLRLLVSDFNKTVEVFQTKFLKNPSSSSLKKYLEPIENLIKDVKPLLNSWESMKFEEGINQNIANLRMNLKASLSQIVSLSDLLPLNQCVKDVVLESSTFDFTKLTPSRNMLTAIKGDIRASIGTVKTSFESLHTLRKLQEFSNRDPAAIKNDIKNIPNITVVEEELQEFQNQIKAFRESSIGEFVKDETLESVFSKLKMSPLVNAIDCLKNNNLLSKKWNPIQMTSFPNINSGSVDVKAVISAAKALEGPSGEWEKIRATPIPAGKSKRAADKSTTPTIPSELAKKFVSGALVIIDLATANDAKADIKALLEAGGEVDKEINALTDQNQKNMVLKVWNDALKTSLRQFTVSLSKLASKVSGQPQKLSDLRKVLTAAQSLKYPNVDSYALLTSLHFVKHPDVQNHLKTIGALNLQFVESKKVLTGMLTSISALEAFFDELSGGDSSWFNQALETTTRLAESTSKLHYLWFLLLLIPIGGAITGYLLRVRIKKVVARIGSGRKKDRKKKSKQVDIEANNQKPTVDEAKKEKSKESKQKGSEEKERKEKELNTPKLKEQEEKQRKEEELKKKKELAKVDLNNVNEMRRIEENKTVDIKITQVETGYYMPIDGESQISGEGFGETVDETKTLLPEIKAVVEETKRRQEVGNQCAPGANSEFVSTSLPQLLNAKFFMNATKVQEKEFTVSPNPLSFLGVEKRFTNAGHTEPEEQTVNMASTITDSTSIKTARSQTNTAISETRTKTRKVPKKAGQSSLFSTKKTEGKTAEEEPLLADTQRSEAPRRASSGSDLENSEDEEMMAGSSRSSVSDRDEYVSKRKRCYEENQAYMESVGRPPQCTMESLQKNSLIKISEIEGNEGVIVQYYDGEIIENPTHIETGSVPGYCLKITKTLNDYQVSETLRKKKESAREVVKEREESLRKATEEYDQERLAAGTDPAATNGKFKLTVPKKPTDPDPKPDPNERKKYIKTEFLTKNPKNGELEFNVYMLLEILSTYAFRNLPHHGWRDCRSRKDAPAHFFTPEEVMFVFQLFEALCDKEESVLDLIGNFRVFSDIHGDYTSLFDQLFCTGEKFLERPIVFIGDIVDRGPRSIDCMLLVCALKIAYPHMIYVIRGNHETQAINSRYGLLSDCYGGFGGEAGQEVYDAMNVMMCSMPMCGFLNDKVFLCHGGPYKGFRSRKDVYRLVKKMPDPNNPDEVAASRALLWADPIVFYLDGANKAIWIPSPRGAEGVKMFNMGAIEELCQNLEIEGLIRGHQVVSYGYLEYPSLGKVLVITLFSTANTCQFGTGEKSNNWAATLKWLEGNVLVITQYHNYLTWHKDVGLTDDLTICEDNDVASILEIVKKQGEQRKRTNASAEQAQRNKEAGKS